MRQMATLEGLRGTGGFSSPTMTRSGISGYYDPSQSIFHEDNIKGLLIGSGLLIGAFALGVAYAGSRPKKRSTRR